MKFLENGLRLFLVVTLAAFCWTVAQADTWDEITNGGGDAGEFPAGSFQMAPDNSVVFDVITGDNDNFLGGDATGFDSYLITVTDASTFFLSDTSGAVSDTKAFLWDLGGNPILGNDDNPNAPGGDFSFGFGDANNHPGNIIGAPGTVSTGDQVVLCIGSFGDMANGDGGGEVFIDDGGDFAALVGPTGENFVSYTQAGAGPPGPYNVVMTGAQLGSMSKGCDNPIGDLTGDGMVTLLDVAPFVEAIGGPYICEADTNEDGFVDLLDVDGFITLLQSGG